MIEFVSHIRNITFHQWLLLTSVIIWGLYTWGLHFLFEFIAISNNDLSSYYILYHYFGVFFGCLIGLKWLSYKDPKSTYLFFMTTLLISILGLLLTDIVWTVPIFLFIAGISISCSFGFFYGQMYFVFEKPEYTGKLFGLGISSYAVLIILASLIEWKININVLVIYLVAIHLALIIVTIVGYRNYEYPAQEKISVKLFIT